MSLNSFLTTNSTFENDDLFVRQGSFATYYNGVWYGMQSDLTTHESYQVKVQKPTTLIVRGNAVTTQLNLVQGWNWISYLPNTPRHVNDAMVHAGFTNEDRLTTSGRLATFYDGTWYGGFTMSPGVGYRLYMHQNINGFQYPHSNSSSPPPPSM